MTEQPAEETSITKPSVAQGLGYPNHRNEQSPEPTGWQQSPATKLSMFHVKHPPAASMSNQQDFRAPILREITLNTERASGLKLRGLLRRQRPESSRFRTKRAVLAKPRPRLTLPQPSQPRASECWWLILIHRATHLLHLEWNTTTGSPEATKFWSMDQR